jgi:hypothetical protein
VSPHPEHLNHTLAGKDLAKQAMLDVDAPREGFVQVTDQLLEPSR